MRLLTPEDFGLVAIVSVFLGLSLLLTNTGLSSSLINKNEIEKYDYDNVFTFSLLLGVSLWSVLYFLATPLSLFFEDSRLEFLFEIVSIVLLFAPLSAIPSAILKRKLDFKSLALINVFSTFIALALAVTMALLNYGYYSLIVQKIVFILLNVVLLFIVANYRPKLTLNMLNLKKHLAFGVPILGSKLINYSIGNMDNFLIGKFMGPGSLGFYSRAFSLVTIPSTRIGLVINSTVFPIFSQMKNSKLDIKQTLLDFYGILAYILLLVSLLYVTVSRSLIHIISPDGVWDEIIPIIHALAIVSIFKPMIAFYNSVVSAMGFPRESFRYEVVGGVLVLLGFVVGLFFNVLHFSILYAISSSIYFIYYSFRFSRLLKMKNNEIYDLLKYKLLCFAISISITITLYRFTPNEPIYELLVYSSSISIVWVLLNYFIEKRTTKQLISVMKSFF